MVIDMEPRIWLSSDLHLGHDRNFIWEPRGFKSVYEMNEAIVENWNSTVSEYDDIYLLGDVLLGDSEENIKYLKQLKGNIHITRGNHDSTNRIELYKKCWNVVEVNEGKFLNYHHYHFYLSHYPCLCGNYDEDKPLKAKMISLAGHYHTKDKFCDMDRGLIYHVELDAHGNKPVLLDTIIEDIKNYTKKEKINE